MRTLRTLGFLLLPLLGGCDPLATEEGRTAIAACLDTCGERGLSETDRATCRLNCAEAARASSFPCKPPALAKAAHCLGRCEGELDAVSARACRAACRSPEVPPSVLDRLATCVAGCQGDAGSSEDDRATCRLICAQDDTPAL